MSAHKGLFQKFRPTSVNQNKIVNLIPKYVAWYALASLPDSAERLVESPSVDFCDEGRVSFLSRADTSPDERGLCFLLALGLRLTYSRAWCCGGEPTASGGLLAGS